MIDEKKCYFFGRNKQLCDFSIDHQSCSRVHAALVWHKHLNRPFLIDLGSSKWNIYPIIMNETWFNEWIVFFFAAHGTYIGSIRFDAKKPQQVPIDSEIHFGASTRRYIIRERPQAKQTTAYSTDETSENLFGLPETETELDVGHPTIYVNVKWSRMYYVSNLLFVELDWVQHGSQSSHCCDGRYCGRTPQSPETEAPQCACAIQWRGRRH